MTYKEEVNDMVLHLYYVAPHKLNILAEVIASACSNGDPLIEEYNLCTNLYNQYKYNGDLSVFNTELTHAGGSIPGHSELPEG